MQESAASTKSWKNFLKTERNKQVRYSLTNLILERYGRRNQDHSKVITFGLVSLQCNDNITQALTVTELSEHECHELIPAGEVLDIPVPIILVNQVTELVVVEKFNQLSEYIFVFVHRAVPLWAAKLQIQIVAHEKLLLIDYVSTISKTDLPAFTGQ